MIYTDKTHPSTPSSAAPVGDECSSSTRLQICTGLRRHTSLADELSQSADSHARCRLRSSSSSSLIVRRTRYSTVGYRSFPVAASRIWNGLPHHVTAAPSLTVFCSRLKTHLFFRIFSLIFIYMYNACKETYVILDTLIVFKYN